MNINMKKFLFILTAAGLILAGGGTAFTWEPYDAIIAIVNDTSIIESDINNKLNQLIKLKNVPKNKYTFQKSRILDKFIEDALVAEAAIQEAIMVNDKRVLMQIEDVMKQYFSTKIQDKKKLDKLTEKLIVRLEKKIGDESVIVQDIELDAELDRFIKYLENKNQLPFKDFFEEIRSHILREQIMSLAIGATPPSKEETADWFKKNKEKLGDEVWIRHIVIRPTGNSFTAEREAHKKLTQIRDRIMAGEPFEKMASAHSQDIETAAKGGDTGWKMLGEFDPYFAGFLNNLRGIGQVSQIFKSSIGYHIVKLMGRRPITYDKVERLIQYKLYNENMYHQFKKWVMKKKKESEIQIFMKNYASDM
jgi:putative peptidyl-prolyl cis-trans isomerase